MDIAHRLSLHSTFYFGATNPTRRRANALDVSYSLRNQAIRRSIRELKDAGLEVGLHGGIQRPPELQHYQREKASLERVVGGRVTSLRQHYWATDGLLPERSLRLAELAGFETDSSLGMSDEIGFRRGVSYPFHPFDREAQAQLGILELTPTSMDSAVFPTSKHADRGTTNLHHQIAQVEEFQGLMALDWHVESLNGARDAAGPPLVPLLEHVAARTDVFFADSKSIAMWWSERARIRDSGP